SSRSERNSRSRSAFRFLICHHRISTLLGGGPHDPRNCLSHLPPLRFFFCKLLPTLFRDPVVLEFPVAIGRRLPLCGNPALLLQPMQRRIKRAMLHLQEIVRCPLYVLADLMAMGWTPNQRSQNEHLQRAQEQTRALLFLFFHGRSSTPT